MIPPAGKGMQCHESNVYDMNKALFILQTQAVVKSLVLSWNLPKYRVLLD